MATPDLTVQPIQETAVIKRGPKGKIFTRKTVPLYLMILPALLLTLVFKYIPLPGRLIAFMDWRVSGFNGWVGLEHFKFIFRLEYFWNAFFNQWRFIFLGYIFISQVFLRESTSRARRKAKPPK